MRILLHLFHPRMCGYPTLVTRRTIAGSVVFFLRSRSHRHLMSHGPYHMTTILHVVDLFFQPLQQPSRPPSLRSTRGTLPSRTPKLAPNPRRMAQCLLRSLWSTPPKTRSREQPTLSPVAWTPSRRRLTIVWCSGDLSSPCIFRFSQRYYC